MDHFVRRWNLDGYEREWPPLPTSEATARRGVINEAGFRFFAKMLDAPLLSPSDKNALFAEALADAVVYVQGRDNSIDMDDLTAVERRESLAISQRLHVFVQSFRSRDQVKVFPKFRGNGILSECHGDLMIGQDVLLEVKSGDRKFRSIDYRQVAIYCALSFAETNEVIGRICLINPRTGMYVLMDTEDFTREISGQPAVLFFRNLIDAFSGQLNSL